MVVTNMIVINFHIRFSESRSQIYIHGVATNNMKEHQSTTQMNNQQHNGGMTQQHDVTARNNTK